MILTAAVTAALVACVAAGVAVGAALHVARIEALDLGTCDDPEAFGG